MNCPNCESVTLVMSDRQGIEIDYCPQCRGVWLDRGELDKIIDRSSDTAPRQESPRERPDDRGRHDHSRGHHESHHGGYYKKKKREGFLSDLFDFD
ncbi:MAG TPA: zf-TFIIB domain-containing protein [Pyrinomonadaceae bacterium]|nr:zf-TFIIB domain-containing protein [Pyrinomonadaceae bacterium]